MVIGSGPGGMEAARVAALRGHHVSIYEKESALGGGQLALTSIPPNKEKMKWVGDYLTAELKEAKIEVHLNTEVRAEIVAKVKPDVAIVATGAKPLIPVIPGINNRNVFTAEDVLASKVKIEGQKVAVLGQFSTGAETADYLAEKGNKVTIIARSPIQALATGAHTSNLFELVNRLKTNKNVTILNGCTVKEVKSNGVSILDKNQKETFVEVDIVVLAQGMVSVNELSEQLQGEVPEIYTIGDAAAPRDIASAIYEGAVIARSI